MKKIILASNNKHKIDEIKESLKELNFEIKSLKDENIDIDVEEDGTTFEENAKKKAVEIAKYLKNRGEKEFIVMADDSGLAVEYLKGDPGVYSARYAGVHGDDVANNLKLLKNLEGVPSNKRRAKFICSIALVDSNDKYIAINGDVEGIITNELKTTEGFGYDPLFYYEPFQKTFNELTMEEKNSISHRGVALEKLKKELINY